LFGSDLPFSFLYFLRIYYQTVPRNLPFDQADIHLYIRFGSAFLQA